MNQRNEVIQLINNILRAFNYLKNKNQMKGQM